MKAISFWVPAAVCGVISMVALFGSMVPEGSLKVLSKWWRPLFFIFLPMCFFLVGSMMLRMHGEMARLRHRVGRLEHKPPQGAPREMSHLVEADAREQAPPRELV